MNNNSKNNKGQEDFVIGDYRHLLGDCKNGNYKCPACGVYKLTINKDNKRFNCWGCEDRKKITYNLVSLYKSYVLENYNPDSPDSPDSSNFKPVPIVSPPDTKIDKDFKPDEERFFTSVEKILPLMYSIFDDGRIAYNVRTLEVELDDCPLNMDTIRPYMFENYGFETYSSTFSECFLHLALKNQYDPVRRYLEKCRKDCENYDLNLLSSNIFGTDSNLHTTYLRKWLIACVARVYEPGCKFDQALILQGEQGVGKTLFFQIMGDSYFTSSMTGKLDKDDLLVMNKNWICEWGELESFTAKQYDGTIKHFLSKTDDTFRCPYGRSTKTYPRKSVIVGTVNPEQFLTDLTGNRRFWIIPVLKEIDTTWLTKNRDNIWASAVTAYFLGESYQLPREFWESQSKLMRTMKDLTYGKIF